MANYCLSWDIENINENSYCLFLIIPTFIAHIFFWIHVFCYNFLHHWSLIWIYNYLMFDMISLIQVLIEYVTRRLVGCSISIFFYQILCTLEAHTNTYVTMVQSLALSLTIFYRYRFIVKNRAMKFRVIYPLIAVHLCLYFFPLSVLILESVLSASRIDNVIGMSCDVEYALFSGQLVNLSLLLICPTFINVSFVLLIIQHVRKSQHTIRSVRRLHRRLLIQFIVLFIIWLLFLLPQVVFMLSVASSDLQRLITKLLDVGATASDVLIITLFDRRFLSAWSMRFRHLIPCLKRAKPRIGPTTRELQG